MTPKNTDLSDALQLRQRALSRWDNEGGAPLDGHHDSLTSIGSPSEIPPLSNTELVLLRVRVIALENLIIALLSASSEKQLQLVREMAAYISPRPGFTPHPLTIRASAEMIHLIERAAHFRDMTPS